MIDIVAEHPEIISDWVETSRIMCLVTGLNGEVYWTNKEFREFIKYTDSEFNRSINPITWMDFSEDGNDLNVDMAEATKCYEGKIKSYIVFKRYIPKYEEPVPVEVFIRRFPEEGGADEFIGFRVEIHELKGFARSAYLQHVNLQMIQKDSVHKLSVLIKKVEKIGWWYTIKMLFRLYRKTYNKHPIKTFVVILVIILFLIGQTSWASALINLLFNVNLPVDF